MKWGSGKNAKLPYFVRGYLRRLTPRFCLEWRRRRLLSAWQSRPDADYIRTRLDYYCSPSFTATLAADAPPIGAHRPHRQKVYFFDTHEYLRYYAPDLRWHFLPGDITHIPERPSIVKSRPIHGDNRHSVVMKLDKVRHFIFVEDSTPWVQKRDMAVFRGKVQQKEVRRRFMELYHQHPMVDAADVSRRPEDSHWAGRKMSLYEHLDYKFILALEGNDVASNLKWIMSSQCLAVMPRPTYETWFMEGQLLPGVHYVEIKADLSDLEEQMRYYMAHPSEAETIIRNANAWVDQFRDREREDLLSLLVLERYFQQTQAYSSPYL